MHPILSTTLLAATLASSLLSQSVTVPAVNETTRGTGGLNTITRGTGAPRTYMLGINASELAGIPVGSVIVGLSFRSNITVSNPATWPAADTTWPAYDVQLGVAAPIAGWTTNLPTNFSGTPTTVRTGPMLITTNTFANNTALPAPQPNPWGDFFWDFQKPYTYTGGDLAIYMTHPGSNNTTALFIDNITGNPATFGTAYSATTQSATTGTVAAFCIPRIHYGYGAGCPGTNGQTPVLVQTNDISGGGVVSFGIGNGLAGAPSILSFGAGRTNLPLGNGCTVLTLPVVTLPVTLDANGRSLTSFTVPAGISGVMNIQSFCLDAGGVGGITATNGVELTVKP